MAKAMTKRERERKYAADPRYTQVPIPCMHCKHLTSVGNQYDSEGWTCEAFPDQILYWILIREQPHTEVDSIQEGDAVFDPVIYTEEDTGKEWHYTAEGDWVYVDGSPIYPPEDFPEHVD